jgi:hypothetical protein
VDLVEGALAKQDNELHSSEIARSVEQVVIRQPSTRQRKPLIDPTELLPHRARHEERIAL